MSRRREVGETVWLIDGHRGVQPGVVGQAWEKGYVVTMNDDRQVERTQVWSTRRGAAHRLATSEVRNARMEQTEARREARKWERKAAGAAKRLARATEKREALAAYAEVPR